MDLNIISRNILSEKPRVTRVPIRWDNLEEILEEPEHENELEHEPELEETDSFNNHFKGTGFEAFGGVDENENINSSCVGLKEMEV